MAENGKVNISQITSTQNDIVKFAVKLQDAKHRKSEHLIFLDGQKTIEGLVCDGICFESVFLKKDDKLINQVKAEKIFIVNDEILKKISTTKSPSSIAGIIKEPVVDEKIFFKLKKIALIDGIKDAGNLGTIIRSAAAFSIDGIILFNDCVDIYNSKTIRSSAQNMFKIPIIATKDINFIKELKKTHKLISTVVDTKNDFMSYEFGDKFILALGSEACGISSDIALLSDEKLTFFMDNGVESINLAASASIAFATIKAKEKINP